MAAGAWPIIGHLRAFDNGQPTHVTLADLSDVYGPVFMTKVGSVNTLIINNQEIAEEIYTVHDKVLNQPAVTASKLLCYNDLSLSFSTDISYWGEMRKLAVSEILCPSVIDMHMHIRAREVDVAFIELYRRWEQNGESQKGLLVDIGQELHDLTKNISLMTIVGKKYYGKSLNWFWNNWFFSNNYIDLTLSGVTLKGKKAGLHIINTGGFAVPFDVVVTYADGSTQRVHKTPGVWKANSKELSLDLPVTGDVVSVKLDGNLFMDADARDNEWKK